MNKKIVHLYYFVRPIIPRAVQIFLRRRIIARKLSSYYESWPINESAGEKPAEWHGWPEKKKFAILLRHDVDTATGQEKCYELFDIEKQLGFRSAFNFVPERYTVSKDLLNSLVNSGFEVGVHGLNHDGKLYMSKKVFLDRAAKINGYLKQWHSVGFYSPASHHNLEWLHDLDILYDSSTFDTDPFEPQADGVNTIFPFWVEKKPDKSGYIELPYTLPQDFTLFILLKEKGIDIWKKKLDWLVARGGMVFLNTHPDYMNFNNRKLKLSEYRAELYYEFLNYVKSRYDNQYWHVLPKEMADFWNDAVH